MEQSSLWSKICWIFQLIQNDFQAKNELKLTRLYASILNIYTLFVFFLTVLLLDSFLTCKYIVNSVFHAPHGNQQLSLMRLVWLDKVMYVCICNSWHHAWAWSNDCFIRKKTFRRFVTFLLLSHHCLLIIEQTHIQMLASRFFEN